MSLAELNGLRIALVGPLPPPAGGMANQTRQLSELLTRDGARVELVQTNAAYRPGWVARLPMLRAVFRLLPYLWALWRAAGRNQLMHVMANSGWSWHLFAAPAVLVAWMRACPVVVNYRGGEADAFLQTSARGVRWTLRRASALLVPSGFLQGVFQRYGMAADIVPNVVDLQRFQPAEALGWPPHLIVARNLEALYDNASAIRALQKVRQQFGDAQLTIAGTGPEQEMLQTLAASLGLFSAVHFVGRLDRDAMAQLYRRATVSLNTSLADNMPNSVLESLASGVPVVSTDVGGVPFLVQHEHTALLVGPQNPDALAQAVLRVLNDEGLRSRLREAGLKEVRRYTWDHVRPVLAGFYVRSLSPRSTTCQPMDSR